MWAIATDVLTWRGVSVCLSAKTAEPIEMQFDGRLACATDNILNAYKRVPPDKFDWMIRVRQRCGLLPALLYIASQKSWHFFALLFITLTRLNRCCYCWQKCYKKVSNEKILYLSISPNWWFCSTLQKKKETGNCIFPFKYYKAV